MQRVSEYSRITYNRITESINTVILQIPKNMWQVIENRLRILLPINVAYIEVCNEHFHHINHSIIKFKIVK